MLKHSIAALALCALAGCAASPPARAQAPAPVRDMETEAAARGLAYAAGRCASCHAVLSAERSPVSTAPPFDAIAKTPGMTDMAIRVWLQSPHPSMPLLVVEPERVDDLAAYFATLRAK